VQCTGTGTGTGRPAGVAGDAEVSGDANGSEMAQEADNDHGPPPRHAACCPAVQSGHCAVLILGRQLAASPMSVHQA